MEKNVYLSYADCDEGIAEQMCDFLERKGIKCVFKRRDIPKDEHDNIMLESSFIDDSDCIIIILTHAWAKSGKFKSLKNYADKCIAFVVENVKLTEHELDVIKKVNAVKHTSKMFGHVLSEVYKFVGNPKKSNNIIGIACATIILLLFSLVLYMSNMNESKNSEQSFPGYKEISPEDYFEKYKAARQAATTETYLPFGKAKYGISPHEWDMCMIKLTANAGAAFEEIRENGIRMPGEKRDYEFETSNKLHFVLKAEFDKDGALYSLAIDVSRKAEDSLPQRLLIEEVLTEILGNSNKYSDYDKYRVLQDGLSLFYSLIKNNEQIIVRYIDESTVQIVFKNVPCIPEEVYQEDTLVYHFINKNIR